MHGSIDIFITRCRELRQARASARLGKKATFMPPPEIPERATTH
jgi:hypothetical protein